MSFPKPPARPTGNSPEAIFVQALWDLMWDPKTSLFCDGPGISFDKTSKGYVVKVKPGNPPGSKGWFFGDKIELPAAPYGSFPAQQVIHIQKTHAIVTAGIRDAANPTGPVVMARAGLWVAAQSVPGQVTVSGNPVWNLPQWPMPNPANYDDLLNFWIFLGEQYC